MKNLAIAVVLVLGVLAISANLDNQTKIGVVDKKWIIEQTNAGQLMKKKLQGLREKQNEEIVELEKKLTEKNAWLGSPSASAKKDDSAIESVSKEVDILTEQLNYSKAEFEQSYAKTKQSLEEEILLKVQPVIEGVAAKKGFKHVIDRTDSNGQSILVLSPKEADITEAVLAELGLDASTYKKAGNR